jgi:hypothetical protein
MSLIRQSPEAVFRYLNQPLVLKQMKVVADYRQLYVQSLRNPIGADLGFGRL